MLSLLASIGTAQASLELNHATFEAAVVHQDRSAFVMFYDPSCSYCTKARPDWDALAQDYEGSTTLLIAAVDCTASGGSILCGMFGIDAYPSFRSFHPPNDSEGVNYDGDSISLEALRKFAATIGPACSWLSKARCTEAELASLEEFVALPQAERDELLDQLETKLESEEWRHELVRRAAQRQYTDSETALEQRRAEFERVERLVRKATPRASPTKDEL